ARAPEIRNSTLSSKKIFDTFGVKQKSWRGHLQEVVKLLYNDRVVPEDAKQDENAAASDAA
ncbi:MAG: NAD(P)-dependent oxidoreductase, partial [Pseudomonadales bacterium]|nr:NAD(P)-dependent oxidoreductase [Pseudomonadales bacterium]